MKILLGVPVHQDPDIFREYLESLDRLEIPKGFVMDRCFYLHNCPELSSMLKDTDIVLFNDRKTVYDTSGKTHNWTEENLTEVARMKNEMIQLCLDGGYDYYFLVDSDIILHPKTLKRLVERGKPIISEIYWTEWVEGTGKYGPNCWELDLITTENEEKYRVPALHPVGGTGALILIKREVLEKNVNYTPIYNVSFSIYEDRAFSIRAACAGYQLYTDSTLPARHLYRRKDYEKYMRKKVGHENKS